MKRNSPRERGSTLILSVVVVLLLAMLGAGFIQISRMDRRAMNSMSTTSDTNEGSILRYIAAILGADVVDEDGNFFVGTIEGYDYGWTTGLTSASIPDRFSPVVVPGRMDADARVPRDAADLADAAGLFEAFGFEAGLDGDDPWLASSEPDFTAGTWPHITNLTGVFLDLGNFVDDPGTVAVESYPLQYLSSDPGTYVLESSDTNIPLADMIANPNLFADADGDGHPDSRWTWAPLPSRLGRSFVMAVRIIDNSALANVNVFTQHGDPAAYPVGTADSPRFMWPGELNIDGPFFGANPGAGIIADMVAERNVDPSFSAANGRLWNWLDASRVYGDLNGATDLADWNPLNNQIITARAGVFTSFKHNDRSEAELRWRNGLVRSSDNITQDTAAPIEAVQGSDPDWRQLGGVEIDYTAYNASYQLYRAQNPRPKLTTISGSAAYGIGNINAGAAAMRLRIFNAMDGGTAYTNLANLWTDTATFANQYAAVIEDWRDIDDPAAAAANDPLLDLPLLTKSGNAYGMEYLPFITAAYIQGDYTAVRDLPAPNDVTWTADGNQTVLIEIVNPWPWEVALPDVELATNFGGTATLWGSLRTLTAKTTLTAHELFTLQVNVGTGSAGTSYVPAGAIDITGLGTVAWPATAAQYEVIDLEFYAPVAGGEPPVLYQSIPLTSASPTIVENGRLTVTPGISDGDPGFVQTATIGTGDGFAALTVAPAELETQRVASMAAYQVAHNVTVDPTATLLFDTHAKAQGFDISDARVADSNIGAGVGYIPAAGDEPFLIGNRGRIYRAGDLFRMVILGPRDAGVTIGDVWQTGVTNTGGTLGLRSFILDLADTAQDENNVNHPVALLAEFSSILPGSDGQDNDGDGTIDEADERFIPGMINVNTMSAAMLDAIIPIPNTAIRTDLVNRIIAGRANPPDIDTSDTYSTRPATQRGIAFLGELLPSLYTNDPGANIGLTDFNEYETFPATIAPADPDGYTLDADAFAMGISYLNQVASVRSDIFTAYILVRAYPSDDFSNGGTNTPLDEYRIVATFDRSGLTAEKRSAKIVALAVYKN